MGHENKRTFYPNGPGTELEKTLKSMGFKERKGCSCKNYVNIMDRKGVVWCENHIGKIVRWLATNAKDRRLPFSKIIAKRLVRNAIGRSKRGQT